MSISTRTSPGVVLGLLRYAAGLQPAESIPTLCEFAAENADDRQFAHLIEAGLSPLMYRVMRGCPESVPPAWRDTLRSADLTAQIRFENLGEATAEIIDTCQGIGVRPTLLKGISVSHQHYPVPHMRPMGDIDILVPDLEFERVEATLIQSGFVRAPGQVRPTGSHHGVPLYHPSRRVWIEVHFALFPKSSRLSASSSFTPAQIAAHSVDSTLLGRPIYRLSNELQLAYIASSWIQDLACNSFHASLVMPLLDAIYLVRGSSGSFDWDRLQGCLDDELGAASLYLMLDYLSRRGLAGRISPDLTRIASRQRIVGVWERKIFYMLVDTYLVGGRPFGRFLTRWTALIVLNTLLEPGSHLRKFFALSWNIVFPPSLPDRYSVRFHARRMKRIFRVSALRRH